MGLRFRCQNPKKDPKEFDLRRSNIPQDWARSVESLGIQQGLPNPKGFGNASHIPWNSAKPTESFPQGLAMPAKFPRTGQSQFLLLWFQSFDGF